MRKTFRPALISLFVLTAVSNHSIAQSGAKERMKQVENNLTESVQFGESGPMNLQQRMDIYKVKGLSIAVIKDYQID